MNFFEDQARARRLSKRLVVLFSLAVLFTMLAMSALTALLFGEYTMQADLFTFEFWSTNRRIVIITSLVTLGLIAVPSLFRMIDLRAGGAKIAREVRATQADSTTRDPLRRRLLNVVEEMAIASGIPVPTVFVLEQEEGINAFVAGWSPSDAVVAVTRGALENLDRDELQGVIAHEFSHILNGDMRLNIQLMGTLYGISMLALVGIRLAYGVRLSDNRSIGLGNFGMVIFLIGYIGLFIGRWIKSAISIQREYLADAASVQFTRNPAGISGALKKIGVFPAGSRLGVNSEEIGHMLFASASKANLFPTHPSLIKRIMAVEPGFDTAELDVIGQQLNDKLSARRQEREHEARDKAMRESESHARRGPGGLPFDPNTLIEQIGQPDLSHLLIASTLLSTVPEPLKNAAHSDAWSVDTLLYLLLSEQTNTREQQLLLIAQQWGLDCERKVSALHEIEPHLPVRLRLPLMEMTLPNLRRRPEAELMALMSLIMQLIDVDGEVETFEYVMARLLNREIEDSLKPVAASTDGSDRLSDHQQAWMDLLAIVAMQAQEQQADSAMQALKQAAAIIDLKRAEKLMVPDSLDLEAMMSHWTQRLDQAFAELADLRLKDKQKLIKALLTCIQQDGKILTVEYEFLRLVASMLRVPMPVWAEIGNVNS